MYDIFDTTGRIVHTTKADIIKQIPVNVVRIMQYDDRIPVIAVTLLENDQLYTLPDTAKVYIRWRQPNSNAYVRKEPVGRDETKTVLYFEVDLNMSAKFGELNPALEIQNGTYTDDESVVRPKIVGSCYLYVTIFKNPVLKTDQQAVIDDKDLEKEIQTAIERMAAVTDPFIEVGADNQEYHTPGGLAKGGIFFKKITIS